MVKFFNQKTFFDKVLLEPKKEPKWNRKRTDRNTTQHVESENALIQKAIQSSFSLLQVQEAIEKRLEFESINNRYSI